MIQPITDEIREELKAKHGADNVRVLEHDDAGAMVVRRATRAEWQAFQAMVAKNQDKAGDAAANLLRQTLVYPDSAQLEAVLEKFPAIPLGSLDTMTKLAGMDVTSKKL